MEGFDHIKLLYKYMPLLEGIKGTSEANQIYHFVGDFLQELGYNKMWHELEPRSNNKSHKFIDIYINDRKGNHLVVEVKKDKKQLSSDDISQLITYMKDKRCIWGILTNSFEWILINGMIIGGNNNFLGEEQKVFHIDLYCRRRGDSNPKYLFYFTYKALFMKHGITNYFKDMQQFKVNQYNGNEQSWRQYKAAIMNLIEYLLENKNGYYTQLQSYEFEGFLRWFASKDTYKTKNKTENKGKISKKYIESLFRWSSKFFNEIYKENPLAQIDINEVLIDIADILREEKDVTFDNLDDIIRKTYNYMDTRKEGLRNKLILTIMLYGIDRKTISMLKWGNLKQTSKGNYLVIQGGHDRTIPLHNIPMVNRLLEEYRAEIKRRGIKTQWLICKSDGEPLDAGTISYIVNDEGLKKVSNLTIEKIQQYVIKSIIRETKDIFTILYLRDYDISRMVTLIDWEDIEQFSDFKKLLKKHPLKEFIE